MGSCASCQTWVKLLIKGGRRQAVRHQPSKLTFAGSNPVARSGPVAQWQSGRLITVWSQVRILPGPPTTLLEPSSSFFIPHLYGMVYVVLQ